MGSSPISRTIMPPTMKAEMTAISGKRSSRRSFIFSLRRDRQTVLVCQQPDEACLLEVLLCSQRVSNLQAAHYHKAQAGHNAPLSVRPRRVKLPAGFVCLFGYENNLNLRRIGE